MKVPSMPQYRNEYPLARDQLCPNPIPYINGIKLPMIPEELGVIIWNPSKALKKVFAFLLSE